MTGAGIVPKAVEPASLALISPSTDMVRQESAAEAVEACLPDGEIAVLRVGKTVEADRVDSPNVSNDCNCMVLIADMRQIWLMHLS